MLNQNLSSTIVKVVGKLCVDRGIDGQWGLKIRDLLVVCNDKWGE